MDNIKVWRGVVIIGAVIIVVLGYLLATMEPRESQSLQDAVGKMEGAKTMTNESMDQNAASEEMMDKKIGGEVTTEAKTRTMPVTEVSPMAKPETGSYLTYNAEAVSNSEAENIILFFHATWCPSCRTLDSDININLSAIPTGTEIYKTDYDTNVELKKKYGVTSQHTLVLIKKDGTMIKKWSGGGTLSSILDNF
jgi:thiol-disulfide isomerase/thioredoxin